jgi:hypothetical protein
MNKFLIEKKKVYLTVIDEVLSNVREAFLDEGYDEQLLQELKHVSTTTITTTSYFYNKNHLK